MELGDVSEAEEMATVVLDRADVLGAAACEAHEVLGRVAREHDYLAAAEHFRAGVSAANESGLSLWRARSLLELGLCEATMYARPDIFDEASRSARQIGAAALSAMCDYNLANLLGLSMRPSESLAVAPTAASRPLGASTARCSRPSTGSCAVRRARNWV